MDFFELERDDFLRGHEKEFLPYFISETTDEEIDKWIEDSDVDEDFVDEVRGLRDGRAIPVKKPKKMKGKS